VIRPLRLRHRRWTTALAVLLPAGVVLALATRPGPPPRMALPPVLAPEPPAARPLAGWDGLWRGAELTTRIGAVPDGGLRLDLEARVPVEAPDLLVYWHPAAGAEPGAAALPPGATLLGTFAGGAYGLPLPAAARGGGALILYSLAHGEVAAAAELPALGAAGGVGVAPERSAADREPPALRPSPQSAGATPAAAHAAGAEPNTAEPEPGTDAAEPTP